MTGRAALAATASSPDLTNLVTSVAAGVSTEQPYADPTDTERQTAGTGLARLLIGDLDGAQELLAGLGFTVASDTDSVTGREYALALSEIDTERAWGLYLVDASAPPGLCIAVPHPKSDARCEELALRLWRAVPGSVLAMAAVHRDANDGTADHSHNVASVFHHLWTTVVGPHGIPQIQVHGFRDDTAPEQIAVSTGTGPVNPTAARIADQIETTGLVTTRSWDDTADFDLRATTNVQGKAADANDWVWVHVEHNRTVRETTALWQPAIDAVAAANPVLLAYDRPSPGGLGHTPRSVGTRSFAGTSRYYAREDHVHSGPTVSPGGSSVVTLTAGGSETPEVVGIDASRGDHFRIEALGDLTLSTPTNGADGQRILVEILASEIDCTLDIDDSLLICAGVVSPVVIARGKRWFASLVHLGAAGSIVITTAAQVC